MKRGRNTNHRAIQALACITLLLLISMLGCAQETEQGYQVTNEDLLYQVSSYKALEVGVYNGDITYATLAEHGDLGLGTFEGLDGEMVALDGIFYQIKMDGHAYQVEDDAVTPFAMVTFFASDMEVQPEEGLDYEGLKAYLDGQLPSMNIFYAFRIEGEFAYVKARSVPGQDRPYPPLSEVIKEQAVFEFNQVSGTMVGFRCPSYMGGVNVPGYHLHFLTSDGSAGGHVLDLRLGKVSVGIDDTPDLWMELPSNEDFYRADLDEETAK